MNERLVNIVKRRKGGRREGVRGSTRAGWVRRGMKNGEIWEEANKCARVYTYTQYTRNTHAHVRWSLTFV